MKNGRFSDAHIMAVLKQAEGGMPLSDLCREHGMSSVSFFKWRAKFGGMDASLIDGDEGYGRPEPPPQEDVCCDKHAE